MRSELESYFGFGEVAQLANPICFGGCAEEEMAFGQVLVRFGVGLLEAIIVASNSLFSAVLCTFTRFLVRERGC
jgi:hypothetical protein